MLHESKPSRARGALFPAQHRRSASHGSSGTGSTGNGSCIVCLASSFSMCVYASTRRSTRRCGSARAVSHPRLGPSGMPSPWHTSPSFWRSHQAEGSIWNCLASNERDQRGGPPPPGGRAPRGAKERNPTQQSCHRQQQRRTGSTSSSIRSRVHHALCVCPREGPRMDAYTPIIEPKLGSRIRTGRQGAGLSRRAAQPATRPHLRGGCSLCAAPIAARKRHPQG